MSQPLQAPTWVVVSTTETRSQLDHAFRSHRRLGVAWTATGRATRRVDGQPTDLRLLAIASPDASFVVPGNQVRATLATAILTEPPTFVGYQLKDLLIFLNALEVALPGQVVDTEILTGLLDAGDQKRRAHEKHVERPHSEHASPRGFPYLPSAFSEAEVEAVQARALASLRAHPELEAAIAEAKLSAVAELEMRAFPALAWLEGAGIAFDADAWTAASDANQGKLLRLKARLDAAAGTAVAWEKPVPTAQALRLLGVPCESGTTDSLAPWALDGTVCRDVLSYRSAVKRQSSYGQEWAADALRENGRLYPEYHQLGTKTGRITCRKPALQSVPRDGGYRAGFVAPAGRTLIGADYAQIELHIAAVLAVHDKLASQIHDEDGDAHRATAAEILGKAPDDITVDERQLGKLANFALLNGVTATGLPAYAAKNYGIPLTVETAGELIDQWKAAHAPLAAWQRTAAAAGSEVTTRLGRRLTNVRQRDRGTKLSMPVQGLAADGFKLALALLWERRAQVPSAVPVLVAYDEIVVECDEQDADAVLSWLVACMTDGMARAMTQAPKVKAAKMKNWAGPGEDATALEPAWEADQDGDEFGDWGLAGGAGATACDDTAASPNDDEECELRDLQAWEDCGFPCPDDGPWRMYAVMEPDPRQKHTYWIALDPRNTDLDWRSVRVRSAEGKPKRIFNLADAESAVVFHLPPNGWCAFMLVSAEDGADLSWENRYDVLVSFLNSRAAPTLVTRQ